MRSVHLIPGASGNPQNVQRPTFLKCWTLISLKSWIQLPLLDPVNTFKSITTLQIQMRFCGYYYKNLNRKRDYLLCYAIILLHLHKSFFASAVAIYNCLFDIKFWKNRDMAIVVAPSFFSHFSKKVLPLSPSFPKIRDAPILQ